MEQPNRVHKMNDVKPCLKRMKTEQQNNQIGCTFSSASSVPFVYQFKYIYIYIYIHTYIHIYTYVCVYTHTHTPFQFH